jgi:ABC-type multidrug transport system fused ATPase/permease subunit
MSDERDKSGDADATALAGDAGEAGAGQERSFFESEDEMNEVAVGMALSNQPLKAALTDLKRFHDERIDRAGEVYNFRLEELDAQLQAGREGVAERMSEIGRKDDRIAELILSRRGHETRAQALEVENLSAWQRIRRSRFERGKKFFADQKQMLAAELRDSRAEILQGIEHQHKRDEKIYEIESKYYKANKEEFDRRANFCRGEMEDVSQQLTEAEKFADALKQVGITRASATFLFVAGSVSLAGVGGVIASLIQGRQPTEDVISRLIFNVTTVLDQTLPAALAPWAVVLKPLLFLLLLPVFFLFFYLLVLINDRLVSRFDETWRKGKERKGDARRRSRANIQEQFDSITTQLTSLKTQLSSFTSFELDRSDYTRLLAAFPYIFLGAVVVFLFSGVDKDGKLLTLTTASIGVVFSLISTAAALLYVTRYVRPRMEQAVGGGTGQEASLPRYLRMNWELVALLSLMVLSLLLSSALPTTSQTWLPYFSDNQLKLLAWGGVALFMCAAGSFALAYGVIQRGIFRDVSHLRRLRNRFAEMVEEYTINPVMGESLHGIYQDVEDPTPRYLWGRRWVERIRKVYELNEVFGDDYEFTNDLPREDGPRWYFSKALITPDEDDAMNDSAPARGSWLIPRWWKRRGSRRLSSVFGLRLKEDPPMEPRGVDFEAAPEDALEFQRTKMEMTRLQGLMLEIEREARDLRDEIRTLRHDIEKLHGKISEDTRQRAALLRRRDTELSRLTLMRDRELMKFRAAYAIGSIARQYLDGEDLLSQTLLPILGEDSPRTDRNGHHTEVGGPAPAGVTPGGLIVKDGSSEAPHSAEKGAPDSTAKQDGEGR